MGFDYNQAIPVRRIGGNIYRYEKTHGYWEKEGNVTQNLELLISLFGVDVTDDNGKSKGKYFED